MKNTHKTRIDSEKGTKTAIQAETYQLNIGEALAGKPDTGEALFIDPITGIHLTVLYPVQVTPPVTDQVELSRLVAIMLQKQEQILNILTALQSHQFQSDELMDNHDVCEFLKIGDRTLHRWRTEGKLQSIMIGGKHFYAKKAIFKLFG